MFTTHLPDDAIFRIIPQSVKKGLWYIGVICAGCGEPILALDDPSNGKFLIPLTGEGKLSIPCFPCGHDTQYGKEALQLFKAAEDIPTYRDLRPDPSSSSRQPLLRKYRDAKITLGVGAIEQRPEAAKVIARCITYWTFVEVQSARLLSIMLKANTEPAVALFLSIRNARSEREALSAVAEKVLDQNDLDLFLALLQYKSAVEKERNALAHGVFGFSAQITDGLVWISTSDYISHLANHAATGKNQVRDKCFVYEIGDLETIARDVEDLAQQIGFFLGYLASDEPLWRATRYPQLCSSPRVAQELDRLRLRRQNAQDAQPQ